MKKTYAMTLILVLFLLQGCVSSFSISPEARIEKRVHALMQAKLDRNWLKVYTFFDQNYKNKIPKTVFESPKKVKFLSYTIVKLKLNPTGTEAEVLVKSDMDVNDFTIKDAPDLQKWILENGNWFFAAKPTIGFTD